MRLEQAPRLDEMLQVLGVGRGMADGGPERQLHPPDGIGIAQVAGEGQPGPGVVDAVGVGQLGGVDRRGPPHLDRPQRVRAVVGGTKPLEREFDGLDAHPLVHPVRHQVERDVEVGVGLPGFEQRGQGAANVVVVEVDPAHRGRDPHGSQARCRLVDEADEVAGVGGPKGDRFGGVSQPLLGVLADRLQHAIPSPTRAVLEGDEQRLGDERVEVVEHLPVLHLATHADGLGGVEVETAGEHRKAAEHRLLRRFEQVIGPVDGGRKSALPGQGRLGRPREDAKGVFEAIGQFASGHAAQSRGRQLDAKRDPVDPRADPADGGQLVVRWLEVGARRPRPIEEQLDRRRAFE